MTRPTGTVTASDGTVFNAYVKGDTITIIDQRDDRAATAMTASASVVAVDRVMEVLNFWFDGSMRVDRNSEMVAQLAALSPVAAEGGEKDKLRAALAWYGEQARLARLIHSEGDIGRVALADDGGKRAQVALRTEPTGGGEGA